MAGTTCNGLNVFDLNVKRPAYGRWQARLRVDSKVPMTGTATIETPGLTLVGTIDDTLSGVESNVAELVVVGGAGGMTKDVEPRDYIGATVGLVAAELARDVGETLSTTIDATLLATPIPRWTRLRGNAGAELKTLLDTTLPGKRWRILEDGTLWFGEHAWTDTVTSVKYAVTASSPSDAVKTVASTEIILTPGTSFEGVKVYEVEDDFSQPGVEQHYNTRKPTQDIESDQFKLRLEHEITALRPYGARVVQHAAVGAAVELIPDDPSVPPMSGVPIRHGLPGVAVKVKPGARCYVMFADGDRRRPFVALWDCTADNVERIELAGGTKPIARVDDDVSCGTVSASASPAGVVTFTFTPEGGGPPVVSPTLTITGKITSGATKVGG